MQSGTRDGNSNQKRSVQKVSHDIEVFIRFRLQIYYKNCTCASFFVFFVSFYEKSSENLHMSIIYCTFAADLGKGAVVRPEP